jgi:hypothetical protein
MKHLPIGIQDFTELRQENYLYVDKTPIVYQLVEEGKYYFLSRPRRFGKSILMSTLRELFKGSKELFEGLWIADHWNWEEKHPVIHLAYNEIGYKELGLREALNKEINIQAHTHGLTLKEKGLARRFKELIQGLSKKKQVVLLIDEYDKPLIDYIGAPEQLEENRNILREFYSIIKSADPYLRFVMLTGVSRFSRISIFSDLNNLRDITINRQFNAIGGYTQEELERYFADRIARLARQMEISEEELTGEIKKWYNGYSWTGPERVYNPFSVLNFMADGTFANYWFSTGTPNFLMEVLREGYHFQLDEVPTGSTSLDSLDLIRPDYRSLLFQTGYLTIKDQPYFNIYTLGYPNKEVEDSMLQHMLGAFSHRSQGDVAPLALKLQQALRQRDVEGFISVLNTLFASIPEKIFRQSNEAAYHAVVYTALKLMGFYIESEVAAGEGYVDAVVKTPEQIYVIEFKYDKPPAEAIAQIRTKAYAEPYRHDGREVVLLGVAFGKEVKGVTGWEQEPL